MKINWAALTVFGILIVSSCKPEPDIEPASFGEIDASRYVVIGDSYMAGYQDGALFKDGQSRSIGALLFRQLDYVADAEGNSLSFTQALIQDNNGLGRNSKPWDVVYTGASVMGDRTDCTGEVSIGPVKNPYNSGEESTYLSPLSLNQLSDFAVPFAGITDYSNVNLASENEFYNRFSASIGSTSLNNAIQAANPTFFAAWLGMEDVYRYARDGGYQQTLLSASDFEAYLDSIIKPLADNNAKGILMTIPDFRHFPAYSLIPANGAELTQQKADSLNDIYHPAGLTHINFTEGSNYFVMDDPGHPSGYRQMNAGEYLSISVPLDSMKCEFYGLLFTAIHDRYVLDSAEVAALDMAIAAYNSAIRSVAQNYNLALYDVETLYSELSSGIKWDGVDFDLEFVSGGFFSLDGFHPNQQGNEIIVNGMIQSINAQYGASIPVLNCQDCNGVLFH